MSAPAGEDIICSAVSSAAYMAANTLTEIVGADCSADVSDGYMSVKLGRTDEFTDVVIRGLRLHLEQLSRQYPEFIIISKTTNFGGKANA